MLLRVAFRNLWLHRLRTGIVGGLLLLGTFLVIVGGSILGAVHGGMERSIVASIAGHLQVYSADAKDPLALFGQPGGVESDIGRIPSFKPVKDALSSLPNVRAVVPMGSGMTLLFGGNALDQKLADLRQAVRDGDEAQITAKAAHVREMVRTLAQDMGHMDGVVETSSEDQEHLAVLKRVNTDAFWEAFRRDPLPNLELLENKIAPLGTRGSVFFLRYIGTDPQAFAKAFDLFQIVDGQPIPPGQRGFLFSKRFYERFIKNRVAHTLDKLKEARDDEGKRIATDEKLQTSVAEMGRQYRTITLDLDTDGAHHVREVLARELGDEAGAPAAAAGDENPNSPGAGSSASPDQEDLGALVQRFLAVDDANFDRRYKLFYDEIAPRITLYRYPVGSSITLTAMSRGGYPRSVRVKVWGTYQFESLEKSQLAGAHHIMDLMTFRQLYGYATPEERAEMDAMRAEVGREVSADDAEAELFGGDAQLVEDDGAAGEGANNRGFDEFAGTDIAGRRAEALAEQSKPYTQEELDDGMVLNAAVLLRDPSKLADTKAAIERLSKERGLGIQVVDWNQASGLLGQFTSAIYALFVVLTGIILLVAMAIINNAMVMATMERTREIGTIRAVGGQRGFVLRLFLLETILLSLLFGGLGALLGGAVVATLNAVGIPATHDVLYFLFAGPALHPTLSAGTVLFALGLVLAVALLATLYPAWLATRIPPVVAMQAKE